MATIEAAAPAVVAPRREAAVRVCGLRKRYADVEAVRGVDLEIRHGEIFAFLGPNGAGKTTIVEILEGFRSRSDGEVSVLGVDPGEGTRAWRDRIGIVLQESAPDPGLTVREALELYAGYYTRPQPAPETIALVGLEGSAEKQATSLSGGQRRRLDFALALVGDPELIFLDEPTTGFDPAARRAAWDVVGGLRELGKTILLTTHSMEEAEHLADRIAVVVAGRVVAEGTPATLGGRDREESIVRFTLPAHLSASGLPFSLDALVDAGPGGELAFRTGTPLARVEALAAWSRKRGIELRDLEVMRPSLEDVYIRLTNDNRQEV